MNKDRSVERDQQTSQRDVVLGNLKARCERL